MVLACNNSYNKRTGLNLAASADGEPFKMCMTLEDGPGQHSYPAILRASNGDLPMITHGSEGPSKFIRVPLSALPALSSQRGE